MRRPVPRPGHEHMEIHFATFLAGFFLLPLNALALAALGWLARHRFPRAGAAMFAFAFVATWILATPPVGDWLLERLNTEARQAHLAHRGRPAGVEAIVLLTAGRYYESLEYDGDTADAATLERARFAAALAKRTGLPVLVTGGSPEGLPPTLATLQAQALAEFGVKARWIEDRARTTGENALYAAAMLKKDGITRVALVTHAWHIPRARRAFERAGLTVVPAATGLHNPPRLTSRNFLPAMSGLQASNIFLREPIGLAWYALIGAGR